MIFKIIRNLFRSYTATENEIADAKARLTVLARSRSAPDKEVVNELTAAVEGKAGTLLTHVSMMIAVAGLLWSASHQYWFYEFLFTLHLASYLFLAIVCVRCQYQIDILDYSRIPDPDPDDIGTSRGNVYQSSLLAELLFKEEAFRFATRCLYILTFLMLLTVLGFVVCN